MKERSYTQIAVEILKRNGKPMHYKQLTAEILKQRKTVGMTPQMTVLTALIRHKSLFSRSDRGTYRLIDGPSVSARAKKT